METLCVTGHRPEGLPWKRQCDNTGRRGDYLAELKSVLLFCINHGFRHFISGGAIGVDTDFAFAVLELKNKYPVTLEIAVPCPDQNKFWTKQEKPITTKYLPVPTKLRFAARITPHIACKNAICIW